MCVNSPYPWYTTSPTSVGLLAPFLCGIKFVPKSSSIFVVRLIPKDQTATKTTYPQIYSKEISSPPPPLSSFLAKRKCGRECNWQSSNGVPAALFQGGESTFVLLTRAKGQWGPIHLGRLRRWMNYWTPALKCLVWIFRFFLAPLTCIWKAI